MEDSAHTTHHHWVEVAVAKIAVEKIAVEVRPREPNFENILIFEKNVGILVQLYLRNLATTVFVQL